MEREISLTPETRSQAVAAARACALVVVRRVFEEDAWADRALHGEARRRGLDRRDRALATRLAYGAVQRRATLDLLAQELAGRPVERLDAPVRAALRLGLYQLAFLDRVPAHAVVGDAVELVKRESPGGAKLVNAVLRRAAPMASAWVAALPERTPVEAAARHSYPEWIADLWFRTLGPETARATMAALNEPAEAVLRANLLRITAPELAGRLGVASHPAPGLPEGLVVDEPFDAFESPLWAEGLFMPQSRAAMAVARALAPRPGERVLDLCAAPGGKTTHLAALMEGRGTLVAVEHHAGRADALRRTARRMGAAVDVRVEDAAAFTAPEAFDRVLVDPPCSDLGTLASRPDARWRKPAGLPERLARLQAAILRAGAAAVRRGGSLVYSTCTISPVENEAVVRAFLAGSPDFEPAGGASDMPLWDDPRVPGFSQTLPHRDATEGFFVARLRRRDAA